MKHLEMAKVQPGQAGIEVSAPSEGEIDRASSHGGAVVLRTGKTDCAALRHQPRPIGRATGNRNREARRMGDQLQSSYATSEASVRFL